MDPLNQVKIEPVISDSEYEIEEGVDTNSETGLSSTYTDGEILFTTIKSEQAWDEDNELNTSIDTIDNINEPPHCSIEIKAESKSIDIFSEELNETEGRRPRRNVPRVNYGMDEELTDIYRFESDEETKDLGKTESSFWKPRRGRPAADPPTYWKSPVKLNSDGKSRSRGESKNTSVNLDKYNLETKAPRKTFSRIKKPLGRPPNPLRISVQVPVISEKLDVKIPVRTYRKNKDNKISEPKKYHSYLAHNNNQQGSKIEPLNHVVQVKMEPDIDDTVYKINEDVIVSSRVDLDCECSDEEMTFVNIKSEILPQETFIIEKQLSCNVENIDKVNIKIDSFSDDNGFGSIKD